MVLIIFWHIFTVKSQPIAQLNLIAFFSCIERSIKYNVKAFKKCMAFGLMSKMAYLDDILFVIYMLHWRCSITFFSYIELSAVIHNNLSESMMAIKLNEGYIYFYFTLCDYILLIR